MTRPPSPILVVFLALPACAHVDVDPCPSWTRPATGEIAIEGEGATLVADYYPASCRDRPTILLLHEVGQDGGSWAPSFRDRLIREDWTVLAPDQRSHGESGGSIDHACAMSCARDIGRWMERLAADGFDRVAILAGYGGDCAEAAYVYQVETMGIGPMPVAMGYIYPTQGTERFVPMEWLPAIPGVFVTTDGDALWVDEHDDIQPELWEFLVYEFATHPTDTTMDLLAHADIQDDVIAWWRDLWAGQGAAGGG